MNDSAIKENYHKLSFSVIKAETFYYTTMNMTLEL